MFTTYLNFNGNCAEAFRFYERCFGGKIAFMQTFGESPMKDSVGPDECGLVMHVTLKVDDDTLMGSDAPPGRCMKRRKGCTCRSRRRRAKTASGSSTSCRPEGTSRCRSRRRSGPSASA